MLDIAYRLKKPKIQQWLDLGIIFKLLPDSNATGNIAVEILFHVNQPPVIYFDWSPNFTVLDDDDLLTDHFLNRLDRVDSDFKAMVKKKIKWITWLEEQQRKYDEAFPPIAPAVK